ncbi:hypothetical protein glysoja_047187 [Glycine soja]|uniref:Uncharacterized protein n=1 Tax=Glycine soja TaxID=3848 RepID=A0A0B2PQI7_GLYSO|nr:hypothetical protein glysoja_047187 [Glycine soja]
MSSSACMEFVESAQQLKVLQVSAWWQMFKWFQAEVAFIMHLSTAAANVNLTKARAIAINACTMIYSFLNKLTGI